MLPFSLIMLRHHGQQTQWQRQMPYWWQHTITAQRAFMSKTCNIVKYFWDFPPSLTVFGSLTDFSRFIFFHVFQFFFLSLSFFIRRFCRIKDGQNQTEIKLNAILFRVTACHWNTQTKHLRHSSWSIWTIYFVSCCTYVCARVYYIVNRILTSRKSKDGVRFGKFYSTVFMYVYIVDLQWSHVEKYKLTSTLLFFPKLQNKKWNSLLCIMIIQVENFFWIKSISIRWKSFEWEAKDIFIKHWNTFQITCNEKADNFLLKSSSKGNLFFFLT